MLRIRRPHVKFMASRRGFVLIFAMGMLALMAILGIAFLSTSQAERSSIVNYNDQARARMLAQAGLQHALTELSVAVTKYAFDALNYNDFSAPPGVVPFPWAPPGATASPVPPNPLPQVPPFQWSMSQSWPAYEPTLTLNDPNVAADNTAVPPTTGLRLMELNEVPPPSVRAAGVRGITATPSFYAGFTTWGGNDPLTGRPYDWAYSGALGGTYLYTENLAGLPQVNRRGDTYTLRVMDCASQLYINMRHASLNTMLVNLAAAIVSYTQAGGLKVINPVPSSAYANSIIANRGARPNQLFMNKGELFEAMLAAETATFGASVASYQRANDRFRVLRHFVTEEAWVDRTVLLPQPQAALAASAPPIAENLAFLRAVNSPLGQGRAPINVNTASVPVLMMVFQGLSGRELQVNLAGNFLRVDSTPLTQTQARELALQVLVRRRNLPFRNWEDFFDWADNVVIASGLTASQRSCIKANANPNSLLNKFNPARVVYLTIDKSDLVSFTTEFCFSSMGYYEIQSYGRVVDQTRGPAGADIPRLRADARLRAVAKLYEILRHTTQFDFENNRTGGLPPPTQTLTLPESLADTNLRTDLDGQLVLQENPTRPVAGLGTAQLAADYLAQRTPSVTGTGDGTYPLPAPPAMTDVREGVTVFGATNAAASDLLPEGLLHTSMRFKVNQFSAHNPNVAATTNPPRNTSPNQGAIEFWYRPNLVVYPSTALPMGIAQFVIPYRFPIPPAAPATTRGFVLTLRRNAAPSGGAVPAGSLFLDGAHYTGAFGGVNAPNPPNLFFNNPQPSFFQWRDVQNFIQPTSLAIFPLGQGLQPGEWHHFLLAWSAFTTLSIYIDGRRFVGTSFPAAGNFNVNQIRPNLQAGSSVTLTTGNVLQNRQAEGTVDSVRAYTNPPYFTPGIANLLAAPAVHRYNNYAAVNISTAVTPPGGATGYYQGQFQLAAPVGQQNQPTPTRPTAATLARPLHLLFTAHRPRFNSDGSAVAVPRPFIDVRYSYVPLGALQTSFFPASTTGVAGQVPALSPSPASLTTAPNLSRTNFVHGEISLTPSVTGTQLLVNTAAAGANFFYRAYWQTGGSNPRNISAYLDDVTLVYAYVPNNVTPGVTANASPQANPVPALLVLESPTSE
ncbi:MAG: hypothetical protein HYZ53_17855 [Planctomycetes bacterium]|nr:hypothetical protein [Planctomycetota bacterium]